LAARGFVDAKVTRQRSFRSDVFAVMPEFRVSEISGTQGRDRALATGSRADALGRHDNEALVPEIRSRRNLL